MLESQCNAYVTVIICMRLKYNIVRFHLIIMDEPFSFILTSNYYIAFQFASLFRNTRIYYFALIPFDYYRRLIIIIPTRRCALTR